jgi:hypothetical protein
MNTKVIKVLLILLGTLITISARADMVADSATFDKAYIPALALTSQNALNQSRAAMAQLNQAWQDFSKMHRNDFIKDSAWKKGFNEIADWIRQADKIVNQGGNLADAHNTLEHVRVTLMHLRKQHKIDYYLDYQTDFHEPMEEVVLTARGKTPATLSEQDLEKIRTILPELEARWNAVLNAKFNPDVFGFSHAHAAKTTHYIELESEAISALKQALAGDDKAAVIQHAVAIKQPFSKLYMMFGTLSRS